MIKKLVQRATKAVSNFAIEYPYTTSAIIAWVLSFLMLLIFYLKWKPLP